MDMNIGVIAITSGSALLVMLIGGVVFLKKSERLRGASREREGSQIALHEKGSLDTAEPFCGNQKM